jgi:hypothetical protein
MPSSVKVNNKARPQSAPNKNNSNNKKSIKETAFSTPSKSPKQLNLNSLGLSPDAGKYKTGLLNPFSDSATGARIPDK